MKRLYFVMGNLPVRCDGCPLKARYHGGHCGYEKQRTIDACPESHFSEFVSAQSPDDAIAIILNLFPGCDVRMVMVALRGFCDDDSYCFNDLIALTEFD